MYQAKFNVEALGGSRAVRREIVPVGNSAGGGGGRSTLLWVEGGEDAVDGMPTLKVGVISSARVEAAGDEVEALSPRPWETGGGANMVPVDSSVNRAVWPTQSICDTVVVATPSYAVTVVTLSTDNETMTEAYPGLVDRRGSSMLWSNSTTTL